ncbi:MAG: glycine cleavage system aminomethyltransferase GcvT [Aquificae bacterium]|nr:glycine cleavage system aminomethyltransferase GcvT [Aquificota bacterium]
MRTPLYDLHKELGARWTNFHGWEMPLQYSGIVDEVKAVRSSAGIFDISHMGRLLVEGSDALEVLQRLTTNNLKKLSPGRVQYNLLTNERGGVKDDITVYMFSEEKFFLCVNAGNRGKVLSWLERHTSVKDISPETVQIALQGPRSVQVISPLFDVSDLKYYRFKTFGEVIVSRTGYTGEDGFEIYAPADEGLKIFKKLLDGSKPCGLGARDVLRIEAGFPLYGHEISEDITPIEANLDRFVDFSKDFIGRDALLELKPERKIFGLEMAQKGVPREGYKLFFEGEEIGEVSSGTFSPTLGKGIALCFVKLEHREEGKEVELEVRGKLLKAHLRPYPFVKKPKRKG